MSQVLPTPPQELPPVAEPGFETIQLSEKPESPWRSAVRRFRQNPLAMAALAFVLLEVVVAILAPWISPYDPAKPDLTAIMQPPSLQHWFGTDDLGRDIFSRVLNAGRVSLLIGFTVAAGSVFIGSLLGGIAGYFGGWIDTVLMRFVDVMLSFPALFLNILVLAIFGTKFQYLILVLVFTSWMGVARLVRGEFLQLREMQYVEAARAIGVSSWKIMFSHLIRNAVAPIIVNATLMVGGAILSESGLSFLGLGVQPPQTSWGQMLNDAQNFMLTEPWMAVFPGLAIFLTVLAVNFVGDGIRDAMDPRQKARVPKGRIEAWRARYSKSKA
ncbi:MAG: ABC transporter permease [Bacillota bacterium]|nr:ABC transporter permease [Bacillota bacterium]